MNKKYIIADTILAPKTSLNIKKERADYGSFLSLFILHAVKAASAAAIDTQRKKRWYSPLFKSIKAHVKL